MKKYNYVYITTNLINGKQYIGDHSTDNLDDDYLGSGRPYFKNAIIKYGKKNFSKKILEFCDTKEDAFINQEKYVKEYDTLSPNGYNLSPKGGHGVIGCFSEESKKKISIGLKKAYYEGRKIKPEISPMEGKNHTPETKKKISKSNNGKKSWMGKKHSKESKTKISNSLKGNTIWEGKKHSKETKTKISNALKGKKIGSFSEEHKNKISESNKGKHQHSEESKMKISKKLKGRIPWNKGLKLK